MKRINIIFILTGLLAMSFLSNAQVQEEKKSRAAHISNKYGDWTFSLFPGNILKASFIPKGSDRNEQVSDAVIINPLKKSPAIRNAESVTTVSWPGGASLQMKDSGIRFTPQKNCTVELLKHFYSPNQRGFTFSLDAGEMIFGTGERSVPMNRRGYKLALNNNPWYGYSLDADALNYSVPFILSSKQYAIFFDNPSKGYLDIGKSNPGQLEYSVMSGELSFYIIPGNNYYDIYNRYHKLVGTQPLPPRWAMGNFMSRFGYTSEKHTREIMAQMKNDSVPFDAVIFDLFWFGDSIKNTMGNLSWVNKQAWPDPKKMIGDFKNQDIRTILIMEPFVLKTSLNYDNSKAYHATDSAGNPFVLSDFYFGQGGIIDIFRKDAQQWFFKKYMEQVSIGVSGWWGDLGEPEKHPAGIFHNLSDLGFNRKFAADEVHNIYGHFWSRMLAENYQKTYPGQRLFHLNRSGYAGSPRFSSFPWTGDVSRSWNGLKAQLPVIQGMSISGIPYVHSDAGGFAGGDADAELYVRWLQFAAFTPIYRPHGTALGAVEPSVKDIPSEAALWPEPTKSYAREAAKTRYKWLPYNYTLSYLQTKNGKPLVMPLFFLNDKDSTLYKAGKQYLWGENVMIIPVTDKGRKKDTCYIPAGKWINLNNFKVVTGPQWIIDSSISMANIPVYAKAGSFIPTIEPMQNTAAYHEKTLHVMYIPADQPSSYELYEDDGLQPDAIKTGAYEICSFRSSGIKKMTSITVTSNGGKYPGQVQNRPMVLDIPLTARPAAISINGKTVSISGMMNADIKGLSIPFIFQHKKTVIRLMF